MKGPEIKVGSKVRYELSANRLPRWDHLRDKGGIGEFAESTVFAIQDHLAYIETAGGYIWQFPLAGHYNYSPDQWQRDGFFQLVGKSSPKLRLVDMGGHYETREI